MADRYEVRLKPIGDFGIWDWSLRAFCSLDGRRALGWLSAREADDWLMRCYRLWGTCPQRSEAPPPAERWGTRKLGWIPGRSPWEGYVTPPFGD